MVTKLTWQKAGQVTEPGRYMFRFGWLTVTTEDLAVWKQFPDAVFTLVKIPGASTDAGEPVADESDEYHLGAFELPAHPATSDR